MGSATDIVVELYEALSDSERSEVVKRILAGAALVNPVPTALVVKTAAPKKGGWGGKKPPFWTKTVDSVDEESTSAHGVTGEWGFSPTQTKPVLMGLSKPRHLYAVLKPTPGGVARVVDEDGFNVEVSGAEVVTSSKDWDVIKEALKGLSW